MLSTTGLSNNSSQLALQSQHNSNQNPSKLLVVINKLIPKFIQKGKRPKTPKIEVEQSWRTYSTQFQELPYTTTVTKTAWNW